MKALILRLDAPLLSFGTVIVDQHGFTDLFPGKSMLTGMIGNALGWEHHDFKRLTQLQERLDFAARWDVHPAPLLDYHTVDLGSVKMRNPGWTTRGEPEHRAGGAAAKYGIHQRYRHYLADGLMTVALGLTSDGEPDLKDIKDSLGRPKRPLFLGRKTCLPARKLLDPIDPVRKGENLVRILCSVPVWNRAGEITEQHGLLHTCWTPNDEDELLGENRVVYDLRDWKNQLPAGSRIRREGMLEVNL